VGQSVLDGTIVMGPASGGSGTFPSSVDTMQLELNPSTKQFGAATGTVQRPLNSPSAYVTLSGVGTTDTVQRCDTVCIRTDSPIKVRLTFLDPDGGADIVSIIPVQGVLLLEPPTSGYVKLVEAKGSARIEYMAAGLQ
jgi:hypothetical protein